MKFSFALSSLLIGSTVGGSTPADESTTQHFRFSSAATTSSGSGGTITSEDITFARDSTTVSDVPRVLKKAKGMAKEPKAPKSTKKPKVPKGGKAPKSAKGLLATSSPSFQSSSQSTGQLTINECAADGIIDQKDALLALKGGFNNGNTVLNDWSSDTDPCDGDGWTGITCNDGGEVSDINFSKFYMICVSKVLNSNMNEISSFDTLSYKPGGVGLTGTISPLVGCLTLVPRLSGLSFCKYNLFCKFLYFSMLL